MPAAPIHLHAMPGFRALIIAALACVFALPAQVARAAETQRQYLSGKGNSDGVPWDFIGSAGQNAGKWSTIPVPSNWELQGFGIYTYGTDRRNPWPKVTGNYKRTFTVPADWKDQTVTLVFEGVMTDTQVKVNGQSAGPMHQGGYFEFKYDVTKLLKPGDNLLEVTVDDESANASVNNAERRGDYWNYGGIFRPVYLEAVPPQHIEHVAIDAKADGTLKVDVATNDFPTAREAVILAQVLDLQGQKVGEPFNNAGGVLATKIANPKLWTAETPNLYQLQLTLDAGEGRTHTVRQKFGFRTIEARPGQGLFVNGSRIMLKGADRHSFWPDSGRCLSEKISRDDIALMKEMNMNAVRMSHYPPDRHFLDACDELGMYVLDELPGWHQHYDTAIGTKLVKEMVDRDVNHPAILFWDNGNEGGWNNALNGEFAKYDPQKRLVLHPWEEFPKGIVDTKHYPDYNTLIQKLNGNNVFFPTEMLHGLYDGGQGAGLDDYWQAIQQSKVSAGGFLWSLVDEDVVRTDKGRKLDSNGNQAPDGIVGPYREKEGSFYAIKEIWSPVVIPSKAVQYFESEGNATVFHYFSADIENRYDFLDLKDCKFTCQYRKFPGPFEIVIAGGDEKEAKVTAKGNPGLPPHATGVLELQYPPSSGADVCMIRAYAPDGHEIDHWNLFADFAAEIFPLRVSTAEPGNGPLVARGRDFRARMNAEIVAQPAIAQVVSRANETDEALTVTAADLTLQFSKKTGMLAAAARKGQAFSFLNGPRFMVNAATSGRGGAQPAPANSSATLTALTSKTDGNDLVVSATFDGPMKSITYRLHSNGWLTIDYAYNLTGPHEYFGVGFDYPEANVKGMRYLGNGPAPVYQNRLAGGTLDVWEKKYNNTIVGDPDDLKPGEHFDYPIFKGYYAGVRWLQLQTTEGPITALINQDDLFVQVFTPKTPPANIIGQTGVPFPNAGISFLHAIPAIGSKFSGPKSTGPHGQPAVAQGDYKGSISLYFGAIQK